MAAVVRTIARWVDPAPDPTPCPKCRELGLVEFDPVPAPLRL